jgi:translocator protein
MGLLPNSVPVRPGKCVQLFDNTRAILYDQSMDTLNKSQKSLQVINVVALIAVVVMNILSTALPINNRSIQEISDALPSYITPAGYTFSIWGLIYAGLIGFTVYQALPLGGKRPFLRQISWLFAASSAANIAWLLAWHYGAYRLSILFMATLLVTLIAIYLRLNIGRRHPELTTADKLLVQAPFSLYLGWITVASIVNVASVSKYLGWDGFGLAEPLWSAIMMGVAVIVAGLLLHNRRNLAYAGVLVWALFGIRAAYPAVPVVANTAVIAAVLIILFALLGYWQTRHQSPVAGSLPGPGTAR